MRRPALALATAAVVAAAALPAVRASARPTVSDPPVSAARVLRTAAAGPLTGRTVVIDPGHQLGNSRFPAQINRLVDAGGGVRKACNTTGTATNAGFAEATFTWRVAKRLRRQLEAMGATVVMTRTKNSRALWGPCVDVRGQLGNAGYRGHPRAADLKISIHGDGSSARGHGFHVIVASKGQGRTASKRFGKLVRRALGQAGFARADYIAGGDGFDVRGDLGTLNLSRIPTAMVELGNMRNASDARAMSSAAGQKRYARALATAVRRQLG